MQLLMDSPLLLPMGDILSLFRRAGGPHLWRMDGDGNNLKQLTNGTAEINPKISPGRTVDSLPGHK
jgi:hypothetical protein